jgi:hypothetical protein
VAVSCCLQHVPLPCSKGVAAAAAAVTAAAEVTSKQVAVGGMLEWQSLPC